MQTPTNNADESSKMEATIASLKMEMAEMSNQHRQELDEAQSQTAARRGQEMKSYTCLPQVRICVKGTSGILLPLEKEGPHLRVLTFDSKKLAFWEKNPMTWTLFFRQKKYFSNLDLGQLLLFAKFHWLDSLMFLKFDFLDY